MKDRNAHGIPVPCLAARALGQEQLASQRSTDKAIEEDCSVSQRQAGRDGTAVISVKDPNIFCQLCSQLRLKFLFRRLDPIGSPI